jgi:replicative DNA helicase
MSKVELIKKLVGEIAPEDLALVDEFIVGLTTAQAEAQRKNYQFVLASDYIEEAKILRANWGKMQGLSCGYTSLDKLMLGLVPGELVVIGGETSQGKTALAVNMTARVIASGKTALFVTLEMTKAQLTSRMLFVSDTFEDHAAQLAYQHADELNWQSIDGLVGNAVKELGVELVVIDHLHYFTRELEKVAEDLGRITKELKKNAQRHNIPVILISHVRRTAKGERATIDDLRGSSYIAQDADIVLMVSRNKEYPDQIAVTCEKNRNRGIADYEPVVLDWQQTKITEQGDDQWWKAAA